MKKLTHISKVVLSNKLQQNGKQLKKMWSGFVYQVTDKLGNETYHISESIFEAKELHCFHMNVSPTVVNTVICLTEKKAISQAISEKKVCLDDMCFQYSLTLKHQFN